MPVFTGLEDLFTTPRPALKSLEHDWGAFDRRLAAEQQKRDADLLDVADAEAGDEEEPDEIDD